MLSHLSIIKRTIFGFIAMVKRTIFVFALINKVFFGFQAIINRGHPHAADNRGTDHYFISTFRSFSFPVLQSFFNLTPLLTHLRSSIRIAAKSSYSLTDSLLTPLLTRSGIYCSSHISLKFAEIISSALYMFRRISSDKPSPALFSALSAFFLILVAILFQ